MSDRCLGEDLTMRAKNQMSWRGNRHHQPKPVQSASDFQQPVISQPMGVSDVRERQPAQGTAPHEKEGKPTTR